MQDPPTPLEILASVITFLHETVVPRLSGREAFDALVAVRALGIVQRELTLAPDTDQAEHDRLIALLGYDACLEDLNAALAKGLAEGTIKPGDTSVAAHLWATTHAKLAVDQPRYAAYQRSLEERG